MLKGLIDPAKEVEKLNKKKAALQQTVEKLQKVFRKMFFYRLFHKIFSGDGGCGLRYEGAGGGADGQHGEAGDLEAGDREAVRGRDHPRQDLIQ